MYTFEDRLIFVFLLILLYGCLRAKKRKKKKIHHVYELISSMIM